jgi:hypothetical protein
MHYINLEVPKMNKSIIGILLLLALAMSVSAVDPSVDGSGWAPCNPAGNYGGSASICFVAWDPVNNTCPEANRDATFTVGAAGVKTDMITIDHLDGIAETMDSFQVLDAAGALVCQYIDAAPGTEEDWMILNCPIEVPFEGVQTFTVHPLAQSPWSACGTYGQVAVRSINFHLEDNNVPEFGVIAAAVAMIGAIAGIILFRRH